jgi:tetratricopeptide (TPR) repeat protein
MKPESEDIDSGYGKTGLLKLGGLAVVLGAGTWLLMTFLLTDRIPHDFPKLPDLRTRNTGLRTLLTDADKEARKHAASSEAVGRLGMAYHSNEYPAQAASAYRIAARLAPGEYQWVYCQALLQEENGDEKKQLELLQRTLRLKPDHVPALIKLADWLFKVDRLDEAAHYYQIAARAPDGGAVLQATFGLGRVATRRREWNRVIESIAPLTRTYPYVAPLYESLQEAYEALGQADKAAEARQSLAVAKWKVVPPLEDPFNEQLISLCYSSTRLLKQAGLLSHLAYPDRAIEVGRRAVQADPTDPDVRNFLARTLLTFYGDKPEAVDEALTELGECLRLRPEDPVPLGGFADDFFKAPKPPVAMERLRTLLRAHADLPGAYYFLGLAADALGETEEAVAQYRAALKKTPNNSAVYDKLGLISHKAGKSDEAIAQFQKAVQLNPANTAARLNLAIQLIQRGNSDEAVKELNELLRFNPHDATAHFCMGFAFLSSHRIDEAVVKFRQGLRYKPDDAEAHFGLGSALAAQRKREDAVAELREALRLRPKYRQAQELLYQLER